MLTFNDIIKLKSLFQNNQNIIQYIKSNANMDIEEAILHSYDLQSGSYIQELADQELQTHKKEVGQKIGGLLKQLSIEECICEAGVGEATTLQQVLSCIEVGQTYGFDISMSRLLYAQEYLSMHHSEANLFCAELSNIPFPDDSIECIYTFHSIEPNGGKEKMLLSELLRVTKNYLILIEPDYDFFEEEQKIRMDKHGYVKHLRRYLAELGANVIHYEPWKLDSYILNKASLIIIEKCRSKQISSNEIRFVSPISHQSLMQISEGFFCKEDGFLFPVIKNIPVLLRKNAILVSHYHHFI